MTIPAYPLQWPEGWKRTEHARRTRAKFGRRTQSTYGNWQTRASLTVAQACERVRDELDRMGIHDDDLVVSSNVRLRLDGLPRSGEPEPADPGAAVYWRAGEAMRCMAIDRYDRVADNLAAIAATLEAMRAIERHGGAEILNRAFTGFAAIADESSASWWAVLGVAQDAPRADIDAAYRRLRSRYHPDKQGGAWSDQFVRIQRAYERATR